MSYIGQAHLRTTLRVRYLTLVVLIGASIVSLMAVSAAAADVTVSDCAQLQTTLTKAKPGEVITLAALCTASNSGAAKGSFTLPAVADLTIQGQSGTTAGFEGTSAKDSALEGTGNGLVLRNLVVENYSLNERSAVTLHPSEGALPKIESDRFIDDVQTDTSGFVARGGALYLFAVNSTCPYTASLSITSSLFHGDQIIDTSTHAPSDQGGAVYAEIICNSASVSAPVDFATLTGNTFTNDGISTPAGGQAFGGGLFLGNSSLGETPVSVTQSEDTFEGDVITSTTPTSVYGGGGEWAPSVDLTSTDDRFVENSLPGPRGASAASEGAGLGVITATCAGTATASAVLNNAVLAANTIGAPSEGGQSEGAGIYTGCFPIQSNGHFHLTLNDSTVAGNQAPGGIAGVDGEDTDQLALANSIVTSPSGQADIGGFRTASGGSLTSSFSNVCVPDTSTVLPGEGNICADPLLVSAETGDVHETSVSPTIDAGSNALVPGGLSIDAFGTTRVLAGHTGCGVSFPAVVDMGAAELQPSQPSCPPPVQKSAPPAPGLTHFVSLKTSSTGAALRLSCSSTDGLGCSGTIFITSDETLQGKKVIAVSARHTTKAPVRLGQASFSLPAGATATIQVRLTSTARALLRRFHSISAFVLANEAGPNNAQFIFLLHGVRFSEPKHKAHKPKKHKPRRPQHSKHR